MLIRQKEIKSVLNKKKKRDTWFLDEYTINPYEGCAVNCLYCYVRGSKYGENMADKMSVKSNLPQVLEKQLSLRAKNNQYGFVALGTATDAYMKADETYMMSRKCLEILLQYRFPVFISTKSDLILRDTDLLKQIDKNAILPDDLKENPGRGLIITISISTADEEVAGRVEPGAISPVDRFKLAANLKKEGFFTGINAMPLLPFISDTDEDLEKIFMMTKEAGTDFIFCSGLTLFGANPGDCKTMLFKYLEKYKPFLLTHYKKIYSYNSYPNPDSEEKLRKKTDELCKKYGIKKGII